MYKNNHLSSIKFKLFLYLFLAWNLSVAQPIMQTIGEYPVFLIAHEIRGWTLILSTLILNIIPPLILFFGIYFLGFFSEKLKEWFTRLILFLLFLLLALTVFSDFPSGFALFIAILFAAIFVVVLVKVEVFKTFSLWFSVVGIVAMVSFLFYSPSSLLIQESNNHTKSLIVESKNPVFIFVFDEFPLLSILDSKYKIDEKRFPNLADFVSRATWYPNTTAISNSTELAIPAILSGIRPSSVIQNVGTNQQHPINIFTQFSSSHSIHAVENTTRMCPLYICKSVLKDPYGLLVEDVLITYLYQVVPNENRQILPPINDRWIGYLREIKTENRKSFDFSERLNKFEIFVDSFSEYPENTLHFIHILMPHAPWHVLPDLKLYGFYEREGIPGELKKENSLKKFNISHEWSNDAWATQLAWRRHLLQVGAVDSLLKKATDEIKALGLYDKATIIMVSDHGSAFRPGLSRRYVQGENLVDIIAVPLFIKYPYQKKGNINKKLASNLDVFPTLLSIFGMQSKDFKVDGIDLNSDDVRMVSEAMVQKDNASIVLTDTYSKLFEKSLNLKNTLFQEQGWKGVYHPVDSDDFDNLDISSLIIKGGRTNAIKLLNANLYTEVAKDDRYVPIYYRIQSLLEDQEIKEILVAINGKIVSHCYMFLHAPKDCAGLIDPQIFGMASNQALKMRFFSVLEKNEKRYSVVELHTENSQNVRLIQDHNHESILFANETKKLINQDSAPSGEAVFKLINNNSSYQIDGWAGDTIKGIAADKIYVFIDKKLYSVTTTGIPKNYIYLRYGHETLLDSGFQVTIPKNQLPNIEQHKVRVFAEDIAGNISEINYLADINHPDLFIVFKPKRNKKIPINATAVLALKVKYINNKEILDNTFFDAFDNNFDSISIGSWFPIQKHSRWIGSAVTFAIPYNEGTTSIELNITAQPFLYKDIIKSQRVLIEVNGKQVKETIFTKQETKSISINVPMNKLDSPIIVKLTMPNATAPSKIKESQDTRELSLFLTQFEIRLVQ